ncbi:MAG: hypothetical protein JXR58_03250 [Bacteroidales bacterium]|nr:hypothetical protein [Bacteroidales bacterium]
MSKKIIRFKSGFYVLLLAGLSFLGTISFSSCKGKQKTTEEPNNENNNVINEPVTKYGVPVNYDPQPMPKKYGAVREDYKEMEDDK